MAVRELLESEFRSTFVPPMRRLPLGDAPPVQLNLQPYVTEVLGLKRLPAKLEDLSIHHVYVPHGDQHTHVLFSFGVPNTFLVIVVDNTAKSVLGFHILDLGALYGVA